MVNLINIAYCAIKVLPYQNDSFSRYRNESTQEIRFALSEGIRQEIFLPSSSQIPKTGKNQYGLLISPNSGYGKSVHKFKSCKVVFKVYI